MKIAIISGGYIDLSYLKEELGREGFDYIIAADRGLVALWELGVSPDVMLGDYDSVSQEVYESFLEMDIPSYTYPERKDDTDTELALQYAVERIQGSQESGSIIIYGATGTRLDHTLANISLLKQGILQGIDMELRDSHNRLRLIQDCLNVRGEDMFGDYVSLIPMSEVVEDICLAGFRYPLQHGNLVQGNSLGVSNVLEEAEGKIHVGRGYLLVIESRD